MEDLHAEVRLESDSRLWNASPADFKAQNSNKNNQSSNACIRGFINTAVVVVLVAILLLLLLLNIPWDRLPT